MDMPGTSNASEILVQELERASIVQSRAFISITYSILTLCVLEIIFTFDKEIIYIWRRPWSLFKVFFLSCRYHPLVFAVLVLVPSAPDEAYCQFIDWYLGLAVIVFSLLPSSGLLAIRLAKLYASTLMRATLTSLVLVEVASQIAIVMLFLPKSRITYGSTAHACVPNVSKSLWLSKSLIIIPYMVLVCIYIGISWHAFIRHCREKALLSRVGVVRENFAPLYILFILDGVVCYITNFFGLLVGFLLLTTFPSTNILTFAGPVVIVGITSVSCCRLALLLHGDPGHATGVYQSGTSEIHIGMGRC